MINDDIAKLVKWAESKGYIADFYPDAEDEICYTSKIIEIKSSHSDEKKLYLLLHECGHIQIINKDEDFNYKLNHYKEDSKEQRIITLAEEFEAWKAGLKLAKKLKLNIDKDTWQKYTISAIDKYVKWANKIK